MNPKQVEQAAYEALRRDERRRNRNAIAVFVIFGTAVALCVAIAAIVNAL